MAGSCDPAPAPCLWPLYPPDVKRSEGGVYGGEKGVVVSPAGFPVRWYPYLTCVFLELFMPTLSVVRSSYFFTRVTWTFLYTLN
jgi:hypothetical protein